MANEVERDFVTIGRRIKERRTKFRLSTAELAEQAGVARYTVIRIEQGKPANASSIDKIRRTLRMFTDYMTRPYTEGDFTVHRAKDTRWNVSIPKEEYQRQVEQDDRIHVNDADERRRLGALGFQPFFTAILDTELEGGVASQALMELHRPSWIDRHHGEEFVYCLRGSATIFVNEIPCVLEEGDAMNFDATLPHQYAPTSPVGPEDPVPLILLSVSMRPNEKPPAPTKRKRLKDLEKT